MKKRRARGANAKEKKMTVVEKRCRRTVQATGADELVMAAETDVERKLLNTRGAVVIKFWDGKPHLAEEAFALVARKYSDEAKFACVQVKDKKVTRKYEIKHSPTFVFFKDGREKSRISGITPKEALDVWCELNSE